MTALTIVGGLVALALAAVGATALLAPRWLAAAYGLPSDADSSHGFVRATGLRDVVIAIVLAATIYFGDRTLLIVVAAAGVALSLADLFNAYHCRGAPLAARARLARRRSHRVRTRFGDGVVRNRNLGAPSGLRGARSRAA